MPKCKGNISFHIIAVYVIFTDRIVFIRHLRDPTDFQFLGKLTCKYVKHQTILPELKWFDLTKFVWVFTCVAMSFLNHSFSLIAKDVSVSWIHSIYVHKNITDHIQPMDVLENKRQMEFWAL